MKKRITTVLVALLMLVCLLWVPSMATETKAAAKTDPVFKAGFAQMDITPTETGLPMAGSDELSTEVQTNLYVTCIAITDKYDTTALLVSVDTYNANQLWSNDAKTAIVTALAEMDTPVAIDPDRIYISATTAMSVPELIYSGDDAELQAKADACRQQVIDACAAAAENAILDQTAVTMYHNHMDASEAMVHIQAENGVTVEDGDPTTRFNYYAHYNVVKNDDPSVSYVAGAAFGPTNLLNNKNYTVTEVEEPNDNMGLLIFQPEDSSKQPIVLANWSARANITTSGANRFGMENKTVLSSDYIGYFRDEMASEYGVRTAFFQGTSGNVLAYPLTTSLRNPAVMEENYAYTEEVDGEQVQKTAATITPEKYGKSLALLAGHGLEHEDGENHLHAADMDAAIDNYKFRFATEPNLPTTDQIQLINLLKQTEVPALSEDEIDPDMTVYANLYEYLIAEWDEAKPVAEQVLTDAGETALASELQDMQKAAQLKALANRMSHAVQSANTNFATDAIYCDATVLQLGKMTFVMAPVDLYDSYGNGATGTWENVGAHFILGNTNGASGYMPNYDSFGYNADSAEYFSGTNITIETLFKPGAGELLMETYANVKKTLTATADDAENQIRLQCECGAKEADFATTTLPGHTHEIKEFRPWYDPDSLPVAGNYYLMTDITLLREARTGTANKCIDLNGHTITRKVLPELVLDETGQEIPANHYYMQTRLFALEGTARLTITDTVGGGKLTRDVSALNAISATEQNKITNYGLLVAIIQGNTSEFILYNGILDAAGQVSGGGACVGNLSSTATFTMYDGTLIGGVSNYGSAIYANGTNNFYGGTVETATAGQSGAVNVVSGSKVLLAGDTTIAGNERNITIGSQSLTIDPDYTGTAGISVRNAADPNGIIIGTKNDLTDDFLAAHLTVDGFPGYTVTTCEGIIMVAQIREYCVCGGTMDDGTHGHTVTNVQWKPWPVAYNKYLPSASLGGNYYLLTDIVTSQQYRVASELHLDLNGFNITHKVTPDAEETLAQMNSRGTRVLVLTANGHLGITDSSDGQPGAITRDLSLLTEEQKNGITNWGLIVMMDETATDHFELYNGILDATGQISGGGACVANLNAEQYFHMHGGELRGGISGTAGCVYSAGPVEIHGGMITGGVATGTGVGGVDIGNLTEGNRRGSLFICSDAEITGNVDAKGNPSNIRLREGYQNMTIKGEFEGIAGIILSSEPQHNMPVAKSEDAVITNGTLTADNYTEGFTFAVENGYIVVKMAAASVTDEEGNVTYFDTLNQAFANATDDVITLLRPVEEDTLSLTRNTYLDLNGWDLTNTTFNENGFKLYVLDTETDDYTVTAGEKHYAYDAEAKDYVQTIGNGYGLVNGAVATAAQSAGEGWNVILAGSEKPIDLYLKITEANGTSFHRLNLRFAGLTLRPDSAKDGSYAPGLYYNSQFGGDEAIKRNMTTYGVGMSAIAGETMFTRDKSYTANAAEKWITGCDANGNSNNVSNGTILTGIMKNTNSETVNRRNGSRQVRGQNYILLANGTRVVGPEISFSLEDAFEGNGITGVDESYPGMSAANKKNINTLYNIYYGIMKYWELPNIKEATGK